MENVILISGDVHMAQTYLNDCVSLVGQTNLIEFTSSGLSHVQTAIDPFSSEHATLYTPHEIITSPFFVTLNYGVLEVSTSNDPEFLLEGILKDVKGNILTSQKLTANMFEFDKKNLRFSDLC